MKKTLILLIVLQLTLTLFYVGADTVTVTVTPTNEDPIANFTWSITTLTTVHFYDLSTDNSGSIVNWSWDFGDGNTSYQQNPSHTYANYSTYNVSLNVTDEWGLYNISIQSVEVNATGSQPFKPNLISPVNNSMDVPIDALLCVRVRDPDGGELTTYFYNETGTLIGQYTGFSNSNAQVVWTDLTFGETYTWYCIVSDGVHNRTSDQFVFTVGSYNIGNTNYTFIFIGILMLISFAAISEYTHHQYIYQKRQTTRGTILFVFVGLISLALCFTREVQQIQWLMVVLILITIVYFLRWGVFGRGKSP